MLAYQVIIKKLMYYVDDSFIVSAERRPMLDIGLLQMSPQPDQFHVSRIQRVRATFTRKSVTL